MQINLVYLTTHAPSWSFVTHQQTPHNTFRFLKQYRYLSQVSTQSRSFRKPDTRVKFKPCVRSRTELHMETSFTVPHLAPIWRSWRACGTNKVTLAGWAAAGVLSSANKVVKRALKWLSCCGPGAEGHMKGTVGSAQKNNSVRANDMVDGRWLLGWVWSKLSGTGRRVWTKFSRVVMLLFMLVDRRHLAAKLWS